MALSGWCTAPAGARPRHEDCRSLICTCGCHDETKKEGDRWALSS